MNDCSALLQNIERLKALDRTGLFGTSPEEAFTRLNHLATLLLKAPISIFSLIGKDRQFFKSACGFIITPENNEVPIDISVCQYSLQGKPIAIEDTLNHPMFADNAAVKALNIVGYLGVPVITKDGQAIGAVCVIDHKKRKWSDEEIMILQELTSSFISEIELRQMVKIAESEIKIREEFVSIASHELKSPITAITLQTQLHKRLLSQDNLSKEKSIKYLANLERQLQRLTRMIDDMSDISRLSSGKLTLQKQNVELKGLTEMIIHNFSGVLNESQSTISLNAPKEISGNWDPVRVEQIIINLLTNSAKYASGAEIEVTITEKNKFAEIDIQDYGPGISLPNQKTIFSKYVRAENNKSIKGLGLGLFISRQIAEDHGGSLELVDSKSGAHFKIRLPL